jgi:hypothetical protein
MMKPNERRRGAVLALLACAVALGASVLMAKPGQDTPGQAAAVRDEARLCLVEDSPLPPLI